MTKFQNSRKDKFLTEIPTVSLDDENYDLTARCKFNFSYFVVPEGMTGFEVWSKENLADLLSKLKEYCRMPLSHWAQRPAGKHGKLLCFYDSFPKKSDFPFPAHVPHQARWGRFRLDWAGRLCGFVIPPEYAGRIHRNGMQFDCNTFYVVFVDDNHGFYKSEKK